MNHRRSVVNNCYGIEIEQEPTAREQGARREPEIVLA